MIRSLDLQTLNSPSTPVFTHYTYARREVFPTRNGDSGIMTILFKEYKRDGYLKKVNGKETLLIYPAVVVWRKSSGLITELSLSRWINPRLGHT